MPASHWPGGSAGDRSQTTLLPWAEGLARGGSTAAILAPLFIVGLLAAVVSGYLYAVEAAATGALALTLSGIATRSLRADVLAMVLRDTMAVTGALFALFVAATTFTLVFRAFGTDRLLAAAIGAIPGDAAEIAAAALVFIGLCALVLDVFEIILVVVPVVMPPVLIHVSDAVWLAVLTLLVLQTSFLVPPFGYALMMARTRIRERLDLRSVVGALAPFLCAQLLVLGLTLAIPQLTHVIAASGGDASARPPLSDEEVRRRLDSLMPAPGD